MLPTIDQLEPFVSDRLPSFQCSCMLHLLRQPSLSFLCLLESAPVLLPSWKTLWAAMPVAAVKLEHLVCFQAEIIHRISWNHTFTTVATHFVMDMLTPPSGLVLHAAYRLSSMGLLFIKRFSIRRFGDLGLLSSSANLCVSPQVACFG